MKPRHKRFVFVALALVGVGAAAYLTNNAIQKGVTYFYNPTQVEASEAPYNQTFRLGGLVKEGSLEHEDDGLTIHFLVTDNQNEVEVIYKGVLPDLFKEGQGVVAKGRMGEDNIFIAEEVLAKHDEAYLPPEVAESLKEAHDEAIESAGATE